MPRKKKNARGVDKPRKIRCKPSVVVLAVSKNQNDGISPGRLMAVAEWRG